MNKKNWGWGVININMLFMYASKEKKKMLLFGEKDSQVADAILIKLLLGNNGTAFAKWALL